MKPKHLTASNKALERCRIAFEGLSMRYTEYIAWDFIAWLEKIREEYHDNRSPAPKTRGATKV